jgi:hypothetical protein
MRTLLSIVILLLFGLVPVFSQGQVQDTTTQVGADWLKTTLEEGLRQRANPIPATGDSVLSTHSYRIVFLIDTSQSSAKSSYQEFYTGVIKRFLSDMLEFQKKSSNLNYRFAVYPYQLDLYRSPRIIIPEQVLDEGAVSRLNIPSAQITSRTDGSLYKGGHNHSDSRSQLIRELGVQQTDRPTIIIQLTAIRTNESPQDPVEDKRIRPLDSQFDGLMGTGYTAYLTPGLPLRASSGILGGPPEDVYVWIYGPETLGAATALLPQVEPTKPPPPPSKKPILFPPLFGWILFFVIVVVIILIILKIICPEVQVFIGSKTVSISCGKSVEIWGPGVDPSTGRVVLTTTEGLLVGKEQVGEIKTSLFGGTKLTSCEPYSMLVDGSNEPSFSLGLQANEPAKVKFKSSDRYTAAINIGMKGKEQ